MSSRSIFMSRPLAAALAAAAAVLALAAFASAAQAAPAVTLTPDWDLNAEPVVEVDGTGFVSPTPVFNPGQGKMGLYVAQLAIVDGEFVVGAAQRWMRAGGPTPEETLNTDGTFSTELEVEPTIGSGADEVDCAEAQCYVATWQAHGNPVVGELFTQSPIYFAPTVSPSPTQGIAAAGQTIAVDGGGWDPTFNGGKGFYVAQLATVGGAVKYGPARWVRPNATPGSAAQANLEEDGTFATTLTLTSTFTTSAKETVNCGLVQCLIGSWPGQSVPTTENLLTEQKISFAYSPTATVTPTANLAETQQVTVSGSGYSPGQPGVYVSQVALVGSSFVTPPAGGGAGMQWVRPGGTTPAEALNPDGTFATAVTVSRTFKDSKGTTVDCAVVQCSVITWRAHTNPTPASTYTSAPLTFAQPAPVPPTPVVTPPSARVNQQPQFKLGTKAKRLTFATVSCGSASCRFQKPKRVALKVGGQKVWMTVTGPKRATADQTARFGVQVSRKAAKLLAGGKARIKFKIQAKSDAGTRTINVNKLLVGASNSN